jgi:hypothetical protein
MHRRSRRFGSWLVLGGLLAAVGGLTPAGAQLPDRQTTTWHVRNPDCTVVMSWRQDPTALTAQSLDDVATITCNGYPHDRIRGDLTLTDENERFAVDYDFLPTGYVPVDGPARLHVNETPVKRHVYVAHLSVAFSGAFTNARPPQCSPAVGSDVVCSFDQRIIGLTNRPALGGPPTPTPTYIAVGDCAVYITIERSAPAGLDAHLHQDFCRGYGVLSIYLGRAEATQLAHSDIPACPAPSLLSCAAALPYDLDVSIPVAVPGLVYTIAYYENFPGLNGSFVPPGCRVYVLLSGSGQRCERTLNVTVAG